MAGRRVVVALLALLLLAPLLSEACRVVSIESGVLPFLNGDYELSGWHPAPPDDGQEQQEQEEAFSHNGRPIYVSVQEPRRYLFHLQVDEHQGGRWLIGGDVGVNSAWGFVESWATNPALVPLVSDKAVWKVYTAEDGLWQSDPEFRIACRSERDETVYVHAPLTPSLSGMYSMTAAVIDGRPGYVHARGGLHLYSRTTDDGRRAWIIGEAAGDAAGVAFVSVDEGHEEEQQEHPPVGAGRGWRVAVDGEWVEDEEMTVVTADGELCVEAALRHAPDGAGAAEYEEAARAACGRLQTTWEVLRSIRLAPKQPPGLAAEGTSSPAHVHLSNGVPLPIIGFGAGATAREESEAAVGQALASGYRLIDGATAYENEDLIGDLLAAAGQRESVSLTSKLWYSELGFWPSLDAADRSREDLRSDYHDLLLLHWPQCHADVAWMRCEETVGAGVGTWQESWRALERLYAEAAALAIGVSNFDAALLRELGELSSTSSHVVQNHRDVIWQDVEAAAVAAEMGMFYQAYSSLRGLLLDEDDPNYARARRVLADVGARHGGKSVAQVALRWEVQQGHGVIPRSHRPAHLAENLWVLGFILTEADMAEIDGLGIQHVGREHEEL